MLAVSAILSYSLSVSIEGVITVQVMRCKGSMLAVALGFLLGFSMEARATDDPLAADRAKAAAALTEYRATNLHAFELLRADISPEYPLYPYLEYYSLQAQLPNLTFRNIQTFETNYPDLPIVAHLERDWIEAQVDNKHWKAVVGALEPKNAAPMGCWAIEARVVLEESTILEWDTRIGQLWNVGYSQDSACDDLFDNWIAARGGITEEMAVDRIQKMAKSGNTTMALFLLKYVKTQNIRSSVQLWAKLRSNIHKFKPSDISKIHPSLRDQFGVDLISQLADADVEKALKWEKKLERLKWTEADSAIKIKKSIALHLALTGHGRAQTWIDSMPNEALGDVIEAWRVRHALRQDDWVAVLSGLDKMSSELATSDRWMYWRARALAKLGAHDKSEALFGDLVGRLNFYGFLANAHMKKKIDLTVEDPGVDPSLVVAISNIPAIMRAKELALIGEHNFARREWYRAIDKLSMPKRLAAGRLASRMNWPHFALYALHHSSEAKDFSLSYPLGNQPMVSKYAQTYLLDPAWVFSITRQESHFKADAKSSAGAMGLMQLMPPTAQLVSTEYDIPYSNSWDLIKPETNIRLGTGYLHHLSQQFEGNIILATAAYNAGPSRVEQWIPETPMAADVWMETIPFYETRGYLEKVITGLVIYRQLLGTPDDLIATLGPI